MDPAAVLAKALEAVETANLPPELREIGFNRAVDMLVASPGGRTGATNGGERQDRQTVQTDPVENADGSSGGADGAWASKVAAELGITVDEVARIFDVHNGTLQFIGDLEKLGGSKSVKVEKLAVLLVDGVQAAGLGAVPVPDATVRDEVERHGIYDGTNYGKHLKDLKKYANVNGTGKKATFKIKYEGKKEAKRLAALQVSETAVG
jgi:hypothetical protein